MNHADTFCGENKVKRFFSGLTYFLLLGDTEGMVTSYKDIMNGKREIPISSCPPQIEDLVYGTGCMLHPQNEEEDGAFAKDADEPPVPQKKGRKPVFSEREKKIRQMYKDCPGASISYCLVDTDNRFVYGGERYEIDAAVEEYAPKHTALGTLYDMDQILCLKMKDSSIRFYTTKYDPISESLVRKIF